MSGLYLHIPFCKQACSYCDFYFVTRQQEKQQFVDQLIKEIRSKKDTRFVQENIQTVYLGGGTPSLLSPKQVENILQTIDEVFSLDVKEVTLEMNPDDVSASYLRDLHSIGVTRASMGVQAFDEELLRFMNRAHSREEALACMEALSTSGLDSFTVDLIYGNPNQTMDKLEKDLDILLSFNPPHVSAYSLTIEPRTRLGKQFELGRLVPPEDDVVAQHFDMVESRLQKAGVLQYEVSNFAKPGFEAAHNSAYWAHENYLGLGPGAHSFWWDEKNSSAQRWNNKPDLKEYLNEGWSQEHELERLDLKSLAEERIMLSLRTTAGLSFEVLKKNYGFIFPEKHMNYLSRKEKEGKVVRTKEGVSLTKEGLKISDAIVLDLIT